MPERPSPSNPRSWTSCFTTRCETFISPRGRPVGAAQMTKAAAVGQTCAARRSRTPSPDPGPGRPARAGVRADRQGSPAKTCHAIVGIVEEGQEMVKDYKNSPALDAGLLAEQPVETTEDAAPTPRRGCDQRTRAGAGGRPARRRSCRRRRPRTPRSPGSRKPWSIQAGSKDRQIGAGCRCSFGRRYGLILAKPAAPIAIIACAALP